MTSGPTLYQFGLALITLYLIMRYVPGGIEIGMLILLGVILSTPASVTAFESFIAFLENPLGGGKST